MEGSGQPHAQATLPPPPSKELPVPIKQETGHSKRSSGEEIISFSYQDSNPRSSSPQPGHYNDYATLAVTQGGSKVKF